MLTKIAFLSEFDDSINQMLTLRKVGLIEEANQKNFIYYQAEVVFLQGSYMAEIGPGDDLHLGPGVKGGVQILDRDVKIKGGLVAEDIVPVDAKNTGKLRDEIQHRAVADRDAVHIQCAVSTEPAISLCHCLTS